MRRFPDLKWLLLPVEIKYRELDAKLWLACCAAERGYGVILGATDEMYKVYDALPHGVVLDKSIGPNKKKRLQRLHASGYRVCVSDEETLLAYNYPQRYVATRLNRDTLGLTDIFFAWGGRQAELLRNSYPDFAARIHTRGTPRTDILTTGLRALYDPEVERIRERVGRYILLPSNFCALLHINGPDFRLEEARRAGHVHNDEDVRYFKDRNRHLQRVLEAFIRALEAMRQRFPEHTLVVRPHPADGPAKWRRLVGHIDRCQVIYEGSATPWLLGADTIFHNGCTTAVEAYLSDKTAISYHPYWDERFEYHIQTKTGPVAHDLETLLGMMESAINEDGRIPGMDTARFTPYMQTTPGQYAAERMLDDMEGLHWQDTRFDYTWRNTGSLRARARQVTKQLKQRLRRRDLQKQQKWPPTTPVEIRDRVARLGEITGRFSSLSTAHLVGNIFVILPSNTAD